MPQTPLFGPPPKAPDVSLPSDPNDFATKVKDFFSGFLGIKPGLTDPKSSKSTAFGDSVGQLNPEHLMLGPVMGMTKFIKGSETFDKLFEDYRKLTSARDPSAGEKLLDISENAIPKRGQSPNFRPNNAPDVPARKQATANSLTELTAYLSDAVKTGKITAEDASKTIDIAYRYPRTLAHTKGIKSFNDLHPDDYNQLFNPTTMGLNIPSITEPKTSAIILNPEVRSMKTGNEYPQAETFAHELQHTGQNIADRNFPQKYADETIDKGYERNKYEIAANRGAAKRTGETYTPPDTFTNRPSILDNLKEMFGLGGQESRLSDAFSKSPQALKKYYDELKAAKDASKLPVTDVKTMLKNALADLKKSK